MRTLVFGQNIPSARAVVEALLDSGQLSSLLILTKTGIAAYATLRGILALPRIELENLIASDVTPAALFAGNSSLISIFFGLILVLAVAVVFSSRNRGLARAALPGDDAVYAKRGAILDSFAKAFGK